MNSQPLLSELPRPTKSIAQMRSTAFIASRNNRHGVTAVEMAAAAPLFFLVLLAIFEFTWMAVIRHTADNAAYEAARIAIVPGATGDEAVAEANRIMNIVGTRSASVSITPSTISADTEEVEVTVAVPAASNGLILASFLGSVVYESKSKLLTDRAK